MQYVKPCPFCGSSNIKFSCKVVNIKRTSSTYHVCMYCDDCKASSPRVLAHITVGNYRLLDTDESFKEQALELWNKRMI